jgi:FAD:protein FMN transferase
MGVGVIELTDLAVATSGNYRHWREYDGILVSHTMDPRTNRPLHNQLASVMVLAPTCIAADAWATALMVMGPEAGLQTAKRRVMQVIFVLESGEVISTM